MTLQLIVTKNRIKAMTMIMMMKQACSLYGSACGHLVTDLINQASVNKWRGACCQGKCVLHATNQLSLADEVCGQHLVFGVAMPVPAMLCPLLLRHRAQVHLAAGYALSTSLLFVACQRTLLPLSHPLLTHSLSLSLSHYLNLSSCNSSWPIRVNS